MSKTKRIYQKLVKIQYQRSNEPKFINIIQYFALAIQCNRESEMGRNANTVIIPSRHEIMPSCIHVSSSNNIMKYAFNSGGAFRNPTHDRAVAMALTGLAWLRSANYSTINIVKWDGISSDNAKSNSSFRGVTSIYRLRFYFLSQPFRTNRVAKFLACMSDFRYDSIDVISRISSRWIKRTANLWTCYRRVSHEISKYRKR
jgi:hypothetical protein